MEGKLSLSSSSASGGPGGNTGGPSGKLGGGGNNGGTDSQPPSAGPRLDTVSERGERQFSPRSSLRKNATILTPSAASAILNDVHGSGPLSTTNAAILAATAGKEMKHDANAYGNLNLEPAPINSNITNGPSVKSPRKLNRTKEIMLEMGTLHSPSGDSNSGTSMRISPMSSAGPVLGINPSAGLPPLHLRERRHSHSPGVRITPEASDKENGQDQSQNGSRRNSTSSNHSMHSQNNPFLALPPTLNGTTGYHRLPTLPTAERKRSHEPPSATDSPAQASLARSLSRTHELSTATAAGTIGINGGHAAHLNGHGNGKASNNTGSNGPTPTFGPQTAARAPLLSLEPGDSSSLPRLSPKTA